MKLLLISTCGTSILTNGMDQDVRSWLIKSANKTQLPEAELSRLKELATDRTKELLEGDETLRRRLSAELNSIGAVLDSRQPSRVQHVLVHTNTLTGKIANDIVGNVLRSQGHDVQLLTAGGLRTDDLAGFREALADLTRKLEEWVSWREDGWQLVFNLTGGFKSLGAYLQAFGMLHADRCVYLFEGSKALIEIPRLPVKLAETDEIRDHLDIFRRLAVGYAVSSHEVEAVPQSLILVDGQQATTSVWGDVVWARVRKPLLSQSLLEPLSPKVRIEDKVRRAFNKLDHGRKMQVNEALDDFSAHVDLERPLLQARTFKALQGNPVPPSTHELYVWSDQATGRLFGHWQDGDFVFDDLGGHL